jgi:exodeoxyribonuclease III
MRLFSWNINSIRARLDRLLAWLEATRPDVLCLQELKCTDEQFPAMELQAAGYTCAWYGQKTYNGVAILARGPLADVQRGLPDGADDQARVIAATVDGVRVHSIYAPNGQAVGSAAYEYKLAWYGRLRRYLDEQYQADDALVLCGDFNVAPEPRDVWDPVLWEGNTLFSEPEREALRHLCQFGLVDTFRLHHPEPGRYSWWDYQQLAFPYNHGLRIDHVLATPPLAARCVDAGIDREARKGKRPSDHAPVWAEFGADAGKGGSGGASGP